MKKFATIIFLLSFSISSYSQADTSIRAKRVTRQDFLTHSRNLKTAGFIFLGIGATCFAIAAPGNVDFETLGALVIVGGVAVLGSIPLFIGAASNKRKARKAAATIDLQKTLLIQPNSYAFHYYPAVKLKFRL